MFNNRVSKLGFWFPDVSDVFINRTGVTLVHGNVVALDLTGSDADVATLAELYAETPPDLTQGPLANVIKVGSTTDKGWIYVVCLDASVADNAKGRFGIIGLYDVTIAAGDGTNAAVAIGGGISPTSGQVYASPASDNTAFIGLALASGPTAASTALAKCLFNGFTISGAKSGHIVSAKTANYTILASESGKTFTNTGAAGEVDFTLPVATPGLRFTFALKVAQQIKILTGNGTDQVALPSTGVPGTAGHGITCSTAGPTVVLECTSTGIWSVVGFTGTWTAL